MTLVQILFVAYLFFQLWRDTFGETLNNAQLTRLLTTGIRESRLKTRMCVPKADNLNTWRKLIRVEKNPKKNILREHLPYGPN